MDKLVSIDNESTILEQTKTNNKLMGLFHSYNTMATFKGKKLATLDMTGKEFKNILSSLDSRDLFYILSDYNELETVVKEKVKYNYKFKILSKILDTFLIVSLFLLTGIFILLYLDKTIPGHEFLTNIINLFIEALKLFSNDEHYKY